jgi:hypothetical protein
MKLRHQAGTLVTLSIKHGREQLSHLLLQPPGNRNNDPRGGIDDETWDQAPGSRNDRGSILEKQWSDNGDLLDFRNMHGGAGGEELGGQVLRSLAAKC